MSTEPRRIEFMLPEAASRNDEAALAALVDRIVPPWQSPSGRRTKAEKAQDAADQASTEQHRAEIMTVLQMYMAVYQSRLEVLDQLSAALNRGETATALERLLGNETGIAAVFNEAKERIQSPGGFDSGPFTLVGELVPVPVQGERRTVTAETVAEAKERQRRLNTLLREIVAALDELIWLRGAVARLGETNSKLHSQLGDIRVERGRLKVLLEARDKQLSEGVPAAILLMLIAAWAFGELPTALQAELYREFYLLEAGPFMVTYDPHHSEKLKPVLSVRGPGVETTLEVVDGKLSPEQIMFLSELPRPKTSWLSRLPLSSNHADNSFCDDLDCERCAMFTGRVIRMLLLALEKKAA